MRATHTPGPWVAVKSEAHAGNPESVRVDIHSLGAAYSPAHVASDILPEDARLIAAAPEMLEALEVLESSTCGDVGDDGYEGCIRIEVRALDRARAAIAKAKEATP